MKNFKIATYNVNSIRSRLHIVIPWLEKNRPDVLCMQETKVDDDKFPAEEFEEAGYHVVLRGIKRFNGVAIVSLEEPDDVSFGLDDEPADSDRLIRAVYSGINVINVYVPQGRDRKNPQFEYKLKWFRRLRNFIDKHCSPDDYVVCCGDLNVARENIDIHSPRKLVGHVDFTPEVWEAFDMIKDWGFVDVFRKHHPDEAGQYSFFDYRVRNAIERGLGWRVDHILATVSLADKSVSSFIDIEPRRAEKPSDHTIMVAEFKL